MKSSRLIRLLIILVIVVIGSIKTIDIQARQNDDIPTVTQVSTSPAGLALRLLAVKGRAAKTDYSRTKYGPGWGRVDNCDMRNYILSRDLSDETFVTSSCKVASGTLLDPYTGKQIAFVRGASTSDDVQIDHVVALSDSWQKGAQLLEPTVRERFANDPLNLLAVDGPSNQDKSDSDAATWLPPNKAYRCNYVARQIAVKVKYSLWVTASERDAMARVLSTCPNQTLPID